ncbi:MAG: aminopeptidase P family protein [Candidatus Lokiarchaeota archaeon]|nr:aminopeptidase P family protein [Candidatus Lokiarchaeota archaeon]
MHDFDFNMRLKKVCLFMEKNELDYLIITNLQNLYWLSGTGQYGVLLIPKDDEPVLFVRRNYFRAQEESILKNIVELQKTSQIVNYLSEKKPNMEYLSIGMELDSLPTSYYENYARLLRGAKIINIETPLRALRAIKDQAELDILREAGKVAQKAQEAVQDALIPGKKEYEIAAEAMHASMMNKSMHFCKVNGMLENWFIVASGENLWTPSTFPVLSGNGHSNAIPYCYSDRVLKKGDILMCDYAIIYEGYHVDHARTYYLNPLPSQFKERYLILKEAYDEIIFDYMKSGTLTSEIFQKMKQLLQKNNLDKYFQGDGYYFQGLGHGVGLELDEPPFITQKGTVQLEKNMVISLEPKIILPDWGAIDLEDNFIITDGKPERITNTPYLFE